jgi:hypothetical protein
MDPWYNYVVFYDYNSDEKSFKLSYALSEKYPQSGITMYDELSGQELEYVRTRAEQIRLGLMSHMGEAEYQRAAHLFHTGQHSSAVIRQHASELTKYSKIDRDGPECSLLFQPTRSLAASNLDFRRGDFRLEGIDKVDIIRLGTVLVSDYYTEQEAHDALFGFTEKLTEGGIVILGAGDDFSLTYQKIEGKLTPRCSTVILKAGYVPHDFGITFPGTKGLHAAIAEVIQSDPSSSSLDELLGGISLASAQRIADQLSHRGYTVRVECSNRTWLEIDLSRD